MNTTEAHQFDIATTLRATAPGRFQGRTSAEYWNLIGPWGGITAATVLRAVLSSPNRMGEPIALTVNFCAAISEGDFEVSVREIRSGRTTQHWYIEVTQAKVVATATVVMGVRRPVWSHQPSQRPEIELPDALPVLSTFARSAWLSNFELRFGKGAYNWDDPPAQDPQSASSNFWIRERRPRSIDFLSLAAMSDIFFVRILQVRRRMVPVGTITMSTFFHADAQAVASVGQGPVHGTANAKVFARGFADQEGELWSPSGVLLATTYQATFYAE